MKWEEIKGNVYTADEHMVCCFDGNLIDVRMRDYC